MGDCQDVQDVAPLPTRSEGVFGWWVEAAALDRLRQDLRIQASRKDQQCTCPVQTKIGTAFRLSEIACFHNFGFRRYGTNFLCACNWTLLAQVLFATRTWCLLAMFHRSPLVGLTLLAPLAAKCCSQSVSLLQTLTDPIPRGVHVGPTRIPCVIHQTWQTHQLSDRQKTCVNTWKSKNPECTWTDCDHM